MVLAAKLIAANATIATSARVSAIAAAAIIIRDIAITMAQRILGQVPITADTTTTQIASMAYAPAAPMASANAWAMIHSYVKAVHGYSHLIANMVVQTAIVISAVLPAHIAVLTA
jgi:hypothetical protein